VPICPLPQNPSLENLRKQAKRWLEAARKGDALALATLREFHPRAEDAIAHLALHDAQLVLARSHGFDSWPKLVHHLDSVAVHSWDPVAARKQPASAVDTFIRLATLDYGGWRPQDLSEARSLLSLHPELPRQSLHAAAAAGDSQAAQELLARDPASVSLRGGPYGWPPLLYACYSRLPPADGRSTLQVARMLLAAGADPDAGFLWCGNVPPFTALTGAFGEGEDGNNQPPHPERDELARALLEAGADPNDEQTLYNRHFREDDGHLVLLLAHGLGTDRGGPWLARFPHRMSTPAAMLIEELWAAAQKNFPGRVRLLVEHGVPVDVPGRRDGRTPYESALLYGNQQIADYLAQHGASPRDPGRSLGLQDRFASACVSGDRNAAQALLAQHPDLKERWTPEERMELVRRAVEARRPEAVRLMASLGFELGLPGHRTPLHEAAWSGDLEMVRLLVGCGADRHVRDPEHGGAWRSIADRPARRSEPAGVGAQRRRPLARRAIARRYRASDPRTR
jgi:ankyrin repeat protein